MRYDTPSTDRDMQMLARIREINNITGRYIPPLSLAGRVPFNSRILDDQSIQAEVMTTPSIEAYLSGRRDKPLSEREVLQALRRAYILTRREFLEGNERLFLSPRLSISAAAGSSSSAGPSSAVAPSETRLYTPEFLAHLRQEALLFNEVYDMIRRAETFDKYIIARHTFLGKYGVHYPRPVIPFFARGIFR